LKLTWTKYVQKIRLGFVGRYIRGTARLTFWNRTYLVVFTKCEKQSIIEMLRLPVRQLSSPKLLYRTSFVNKSLYNCKYNIYLLKIMAIGYCVITWSFIY
jgi:hypothetical protein